MKATRAAFSRGAARGHSLPLRPQPQAPEAGTRSLFRHPLRLVGRGLLPYELPISLVFAPVAVGVEMPLRRHGAAIRFAILLAAEDLPRRQRLKVRELVGRVGWLQLES